jgi:hypothetical protein
MNQPQGENNSSDRTPRATTDAGQLAPHSGQEPDSIDVSMDTSGLEPDQNTEYMTPSENFEHINEDFDTIMRDDDGHSHQSHQSHHSHHSHQAGTKDSDRPLDKYRQDRERLNREREEKTRKMKEEREEKDRQRKEARRRAQMEQQAYLEEQVHHLESQIRAKEEDTQEIEGQFDQLEQTCQELRSQWEEAEKQLAKHRELLNASRAFSSREGTIDAQGLLQPFNDLNSSIGDFAYQVLCSVDEGQGGQAVEAETYKSLFRELGGEVPEEILAVLQPGQLTVMDVIDSLIQFAICSALHDSVFGQFVPGLNKYEEDIEMLGKMYKRMCKVEPQERTARWRAITFNRASAMTDKSFLEDASKECLERIRTMLKILSPASTLPDTCESALHAIFKAAFAVQKKAKTEYISYDYEVEYIEPMARFKEETMEACQGKPETKAHHVCMTTLFGLVAKKRTMVERTDGQWRAQEERSVPVKATVICDNWDPNA